MAASNQPLSVLTSNRTQLHEVTRRSANFHPTIWGDYFLSYSSRQKETNTQEQQEHHRLKEKVKNMLVEAPHISSQKLDLIDKLQRLGVSYQFKKEIEAILQHIFEAHHEFSGKDENDLYMVSLQFRLLRQEGYHVPSNVFERFKDNDGKFKESLTNNVQAMLSLYEASHLRVHEEKILDEALTFTTSHLETMLPSLTNSLRSEVRQSLQRPLHKRLTRIEAKRYISTYELDQSHNVVLLKFAKLDFNMLQKEHQWEIGSLTRWWKDMDFIKKLSFARDRLVECYLWALGVYFEPQYYLPRKFLTQVLALATVIDDIFDVYGTPNELLIFNDAIQRWDASAINELPNYMGVCYSALLDIYAQMEKELGPKGRAYQVKYAIIEMKKLVGAYYEEAKWFHDGSPPNFEEYMKNAIASSGYMMVATSSLVGIPEDFVTKEAFDWVTNEPLIVRASSIIARLMDDIAGHKVEQQRGDVDSAVECYMKQYGKSEEETVKDLQEQITCAWKDMNQECLKPTIVHMPILIRVVNLARVIDLLYKDKDIYTHSTTELKAIITSLLVDPII
ncbi:PREDICTED: (-)-germacrene D synthase-like [Ipomoea nil]|uniref:(-)-germacrene D synthase-like n=1 Tax=Ipomoea nil TaxID=35883 RepID=UPI000901EBEA|nr:PREDICTED: (-)-germacrene D synthase-like [Ipomoea nil]